MSELNVKPIRKHSFHLPHCSRARPRFAAIAPGPLRDWDRLSSFTTEDTTLKDPPENIYTESEVRVSITITH